MTVTQFPAARKEKVGSKYWMKQVSDSITALNGKFSTESVHDLRVALRRCIAIADRMRDLAPASSWHLMRKRARKLFSSMGAMRDSQVLSEWIKCLDPDGGAPSTALLAALNKASDFNRHAAQREIVKFDRELWRDWTRELASDFRRVAADRAVCECLAVEVLEAVRHRHRLAQKNPGSFAFHRLRVEVKTFRYTIENFLPNLYPGWAPDLKFLQDVLGEIHDLDVLSGAIKQNRGLLDQAALEWWEGKLEAERSSRVQKYRQKMSDDGSPLTAWREVLPGERERRGLGLAKLSAWASFLTPNFARTRRISKFALQLRDGLSNCGLIGQVLNLEERTILHAAALLQDVGRSAKGKGYHKESYRMIRHFAPPVGWSKRDLTLVATITRFHRRALPRPDHKVLKDYTPAVRHTLLFEVAILRLANAFGAKAYKSVRRLEIERFDTVVVVRADGYSEGDRLTPKLSVALHLMESVCLHPVRVLPRGARMMESQLLPQSVHPLVARSS